MPSPSHSLLSYLRVVVGAWRDDPRDDAALLACFAEARDEAAFATLVWRHGALVWQTCWRILGDTPDAEDAFQAAFLALARKAGRFPVESLAGWLHRVARQAALDARIGTRRRRGLEQRLQDVRRPEAEGEDANRAELYAALDEELVGLPEQLRVPLVLRYLEGKTLEDVACIVGCSRPVVSKRLVRGEAILRKRLEQRGLAVCVVSIGALLGSTGTVSAVPARLIGSTARAAVAFRSGFLTGGTAEAAARAVLGALPSSLGTTIMRKSLWIVLACSLGLGGAALVACRTLSARLDEPGEAGVAAAQSAEQPGPVGRATVRVDCYGDPLPVGARARLGTVRLRHLEWIYSVAFASDGKTVAAGDHDGTIRLWEVATGKEICTLQGHQGSVWSVAFSPDGKTVASGGGDRVVRLWEAATGKEIRTLKGHREGEGGINSVAFASDGKTVASGGHDGTIRLWEVATGKEVQTLQGRKGEPFRLPQGGVFSVAFVFDGKTVASGGRDGTVCLWEVTTGKEIRTLKGYQGRVLSVAFTSDGKTVASSGDNGTVRLWEVATGKEICTLQGHQGSVWSVAFSSDGKTVASGGRDSTVRLWDVATGKEIRTLKGHQWGIRGVAFTSDGKTVASGGGDRVVRLWEAATGKEIRIQQGHQGPIDSVAFSSDGKTVASAGIDGTVRLWETATGKEIRILKGHQGEVFSVAFSSDGKTVASAGIDGTVRLWEAATGKEIRTLKGHQGWVKSVVFSSDGKTVASGATDGTVRLWEAATGKEIRTLRGHQGRVLSVAFSSDGETVSSGGEDGTVRLWRVATGKEIRTLRGHQGWVFSVAFSSDGKTVASGGRDDDTVRLWEAATGKEIRTLKGHHGGVLSVAFSSDGKIVASGGRDVGTNGTVRLWEAATGKEIRTLKGHKRGVHSVAFSPDGRTLASGSTDTTGLIWDVAFLTRPNPMRVRPLPPPARSEEQQLEAAWNELVNADPAKAHPALWKLTRSPAQAITLLRARLRPVAPLADPQQLQHWIADLDADSFTVRDKARREIAKLGEPAFPALRQALKGRPSVEVRRRLNDLLTEVPAERLRELRAVQVLEYTGTAEARQVLQALAKGASGARLSVEAQAALDRLAKRSVAQP